MEEAHEKGRGRMVLRWRMMQRVLSSLMKTTRSVGLRMRRSMEMEIWGMSLRCRRRLEGGIGMALGKKGSSEDVTKGRTAGVDVDGPRG